jgi:hypothetical protein
MESLINKLPEDIVLIVSSYYGNRISTELSTDINDQKFLYSIKDKYYFNDELRIWNTHRVCFAFLKNLSIDDEYKEKFDSLIWKEKDIEINKIWRKLASIKRRELLEKHFPNALSGEFKCLTLGGMVFLHFGHNYWGKQYISNLF